MLNVLRSSLIYRIIAAIGNWFGGQWRSSAIIGRFLTYSRGEAGAGALGRVAYGVLNGWRAVCAKLKLEKLLNNSIFQMPFLWCVAALFLAPLIPTMALLAVVLVAFAVTFVKLGIDKERKLAYSPLNKFILLYALVYFLSIFISVTISGSLRHGILQVTFILFALVIENSLNSKKKFEWAIRLFVISGTLVCAYGVYQYLFGADVTAAWVDSEMFSNISTRVYSTLENPNVLAEYILLVVPFAFALTLTSESQLTKVFFGCCTAGIIGCMLLTFARGGWLGLIVAAAVMLVIIDRRFILLGIVGLAALYFTLPDVILNRFLSIGDLSDGSTSYRLNIWLGTLSMLKDYWFSGIGPGIDAFNEVYPLYSYNTVAAPHSHNLFLQLICDSGIAGICIFVAMLFVYYRSMCSAGAKLAGKARANLTKRSPEFYYLAAGIASLTGFLVQGMTDYSFYNYRVALVFWAVVGLFAVASRRVDWSSD